MDGIGSLIVMVLILGGILSEAWMKRKKEMERRQAATREQREAAERRAAPPATREVLVEETRTPVEPPEEAPAPPRPAPATLEGSMREIARRLGLPEEILPPPPASVGPHERPAQKPKPRKPKRQAPAPSREAVVAVEVPRPARPLARELTRRVVISGDPLVFSPDPVVNAIIVSEVLLTPRQRSVLRRTRGF